MSRNDRFSTTRARPPSSSSRERDRAWGAFSVATPGVCFSKRYFSEAGRRRMSVCLAVRKTQDLSALKTWASCQPVAVAWQDTPLHGILAHE